MRISNWSLVDPRQKNHILYEHTEEIMQLYKDIIDICRENPRKTNPKVACCGVYFKDGKYCLIGKYLYKHKGVSNSILESLGNKPIHNIYFPQSHIVEVFSEIQHLADEGYKWGEIGQYINKTIFGKDWWEV